MVLDSHEQEQMEAFKAWWKQNRAQLLGGLLIVVTVLGGWSGWQYFQGKQTREAAILYAEFSTQLESNDVQRINDAAAAMMDKFSSTTYASRAALLAAQVNEQRKDVTHAKTQLQWVIAHASEPSLKDVARLRLAAILLDEKNYTDAMQLLETEHPAAFDGLYADLKGDLLAAQGKNDEAKAAYQLAIEKIDAKSMYRNLVQLKLDALTGIAAK